jgi:hypothetical protein
MTDTDTLERPDRTEMHDAPTKANTAGACIVPGAPPPCPDYADEITADQLDAIRRRIDPDGNRAKRRTVIHAPAW